MRGDDHDLDAVAELPQDDRLLREVVERIDPEGARDTRERRMRRLDVVGLRAVQGPGRVELLGPLDREPAGRQREDRDGGPGPAPEVPGRARESEVVDVMGGERSERLVGTVAARVGDRRRSAVEGPGDEGLEIGIRARRPPVGEARAARRERRAGRAAADERRRQGCDQQQGQDLRAPPPGPRARPACPRAGRRGRDQVRQTGTGRGRRVTPRRSRSSWTTRAAASSSGSRAIVRASQSM